VCCCHSNQVVFGPLDGIHEAWPVCKAHLVAHGPQPVLLLLVFLLLLHVGNLLEFAVAAGSVSETARPKRTLSDAIKLQT
jgi:hypothetical protein